MLYVIGAIVVVIVLYLLFKEDPALKSEVEAKLKALETAAKNDLAALELRVKALESKIVTEVKTVVDDVKAKL